MYYLLYTVLFLLPSFGFATPAQPISSHGTIAIGPGTSNGVGIGPIDPRLNLTFAYQTNPLDQDQCVVVATQLLGVFSAGPWTYGVGDIQFWDDRFTKVQIRIRAFRGETTEARFLIWGLYSGIKDMIETNRFRNNLILIR